MVTTLVALVFLDSTSLTLLPAPTAQDPIVVQRGLQFEIPLIVDNQTGVGSWGPASRVADHAVIAINADKDIAVTYDANRPDLGNAAVQVEVALFKYSGNESWQYKGNLLLGDAHLDALQYSVSLVRCERPDVVAVGNAFMVHWTRRYTTLPNDPAVAECAWIRWDASSQTFQTYTGVPVVPGQGFVLDYDLRAGANYWVEECAGVPDAVPLDDSTSLLTAGIVYVHQEHFAGGASGPRDFQLRFVTTAFDSANPNTPITASTPSPLFANLVRFDGPSNDANGLILPEVAAGSTKDRFILAYEEQLETAPGSGAHFGRIALHRIDNIGGTWTSQQSHTFGSGSGTLYSRRRPNIASDRQASLAAGKELVSVAFNKIVPTIGNADVVYEEWAMDPVNGVYRVIWPAGTGWENDPGGVAEYDFRPMPIHGRHWNFRRLLCGRLLTPPPPIGVPPPPQSPRRLLEYRMATDDTILIDEEGDIGRPHADYLYDPLSAQPDYVVVSWEQATTGQADTRIRILVR